jgi:iduronate 2-sulfatase
MVDDLGTQVGAYGDKTALTPNINAIAARGIRFDSQFVDQPTCIPARAAMLTGVRTARTGQLFGTHTFRKHKGIQSAAEIFIKAGYATYTFGKVFHFRTEYLGTTAGFNGRSTLHLIAYLAKFFG